MPVYVYEAKDLEKGCPKCSKGFETVQSIKDEHLTKCPACGAEIYRALQPSWLGFSKTDLHYRAKRAGFHSMKRIAKGEYEKMY